jgi:hypothetical protein
MEGTLAVAAYYHHVGNETLQLAGVPFGWAAKPFAWVPGAMWSHVMTRYCQFLMECSNQTNSNNNNSKQQQQTSWLDSFVRINGENQTLPSVDDDFYAEPPDDDASLYVQVQ